MCQQPNFCHFYEVLKVGLEIFKSSKIILSILGSMHFDPFLSLSSFNTLLLNFGQWRLVKKEMNIE